jgi:nitrogen fixation/metabolism regulation signal transduction histidine kinase
LLLLTKYKYLIYAFGSVLLAFWLQWLINEPLDHLKYVAKIAENLQKEISIADETAYQMKKKMERGISFTFLWKDTKYPVYIFENKNLIFWTNHNFHLNYQDLRGYFVDKCIKTEDGIFFVKKSVQTINGKEFEIVTVIPLYRKYFIDNEYLTSHLNPDIFDKNDNIKIIFTDKTDKYAVTTRYGTYLFSILFLDDWHINSDYNWLVVIFFLASFVLLIVQVCKNLLEKINQQKYKVAFLYLFIFLVALRAIMLNIKYPINGKILSIFEPTVFASSIFSPTLGDLLLNLFCAFILIIFIFYFYPHLFFYKKLIHAGNFIRTAVASLAVTLSYVTAFMIFFILKGIYFNSKINLDITTDVGLDLNEITAYMCYIFTAIIYFIVVHIGTKLYVKLSKNLFEKLISLSIGMVLGALLPLLIDEYTFAFFVVNSIYFLCVVIFDLPRNFQKAGYPLFIYVFTCALFCAGVGAHAIFVFDKQKDVINKKRFAEQIIFENDVLGEIFLKELTDKITQGAVFTSSLPLDIPKKIKRIYLNRYFDKYDVNVYVFDNQGVSYNSPFVFDSLYAAYNLPRFKTEHDNIFLINDLLTTSKQYACFVNIPQSQHNVGKIVIDLRLKKIIPNSIHPNFFVDKKYGVTDIENQNYSYAIYINKQLVYTYGAYIYNLDFQNKFTANHQEIDELTFDGYHHIRINQDINKVIIVSSQKYPAANVFSNFSFLFLLLVFVILLFVAIYSLFKQRRKNSLNLTVKIQLYLNSAFFLPLIIVSAVTISILNTSHRDETKTYYLEKAATVSAEIRNELENYLNQKQDLTKLTETVIEVAKLTQSDINIYGRNGALIAASQSYMYEHNLLTDVINPQAYALLVEQQQNKVIFDENIGKLQYNSAYVNIKSYATGEILGIVGIPFFGSKFKADEQIASVLSTILTIFTIIFLGLLAISYFASRALSAPLILITQKIKKTSLSEHNEPLDYSSDDEIGLLVGEYNKMLLKLEESKAALAQKEKESAWREIAKQVAHEIKNPLTPMKLKIQQLQYLQNYSDERVNQVANALLIQIELLSEIASSFAAFAQMPIPKEEVFEISSSLNEVLSLFETGKDIEIIKDIPKGEFFVLGDEKLLKGAFNNLIINGIQSVGEHILPKIEAKLVATNNHKILISIKDNGSGISEEIQHKVFMPNFTTKKQGSGLGLPIAKRSIEHLGGSMWFETEINKGTTFYIEIPRIMDKTNILAYSGA